MNPRSARILAAILLLTSMALFLGACAVSKSPVTGKKRAYAYTWQQELQIGKEADGQITAQYGLYGDDDLAAYVTRIGERVLAQSHLRRADALPEYRSTQFTFRVLDSPVVNAFALPGGFVYVTRGLLVHLQNEAQLAVVLGHEIGHVAARHSSQRALSGQLAQIGLIAGAIGGELLGVDGRSILQKGGLAAQLLLLRYSRDDERESDALGVEYAAISGYAAAEGAALFTSLKRISEESGSSIPGFFSTHPDPGEREVTIPRMAAKYAETYQMDTVNEAPFLAQLDEVVYGDNPRQGFVENGMFHHPDLAFSFPVPGEWAVQNQPTQVALFTAKQDAVIVFDIDSESKSAADAAKRLSSNEGIVVSGDSSERINGFPAHRLEATAQTQNGQALKLMAVFVEYGDNVYRFIGYTSAASYATYQQTFANTMRGFRQLTDQRLLNIQPARVDVRRADRQASFQSFLPAALPLNLTKEGLAIANQLHLETAVASGRELKLLH